MRSWPASAMDHYLPALRGATRYAMRVRAILRRRVPAIAGFVLLMLLFNVARALTIGMPPLGSLTRNGFVVQWLLLTAGMTGAVVAPPALVEAAGLHRWRGVVATLGGMLALVGAV